MMMDPSVHRSTTRPLGTLQVDVDDLWVYYESIGLVTPADAPPAAYTQGIPRLLDLFDRYGIRGTFFVCGRDLAGGTTSLQARTVAEMVRRGHEVANHSAAHRNGYARLSLDALRDDVRAAGDRIAEAAGQAPVGFKAPGFSFNPHLPGVLAEQGYLYDSSVLPTPYAAGLRLLQRVLSGGHVDPTHYGRFVYGLAPLRPWRYGGGTGKLGPGLGTSAGFSRRQGRPAEASNPDDPLTSSRRPPPIWEAPVTTMPLLRVPMHSTFVLSAGRWLFDLGLALARLRRVPINYLLHAADAVGPVADPALASYRFLTQPWKADGGAAGKEPLYASMLAELSRHYRLVPTREFIQGLFSP